MKEHLKIFGLGLLVVVGLAVAGTLLRLLGFLVLLAIPHRPLGQDEVAAVEFGMGIMAMLVPLLVWVLGSAAAAFIDTVKMYRPK